MKKRWFSVFSPKSKLGFNNCQRCRESDKLYLRQSTSTQPPVSIKHFLNGSEFLFKKTDRHGKESWTTGRWEKSALPALAAIPQAGRSILAYQTLFTLFFSFLTCNLYMKFTEIPKYIRSFDRPKNGVDLDGACGTSYLGPFSTKRRSETVQTSCMLKISVLLYTRQDCQRSRVHHWCQLFTPVNTRFLYVKLCKKTSFECHNSNKKLYLHNLPWIYITRNQ